MPGRGCDSMLLTRVVSCGRKALMLWAKDPPHSFLEPLCQPATLSGKRAGVVEHPSAHRPCPRARWVCSHSQGGVLLHHARRAERALLPQPVADQAQDHQLLEERQAWCVGVCVCASPCVCACACTCGRVCVCALPCVCACACMCWRVRVRVCVCMRMSAPGRMD